MHLAGGERLRGQRTSMRQALTLRSDPVAEAILAAARKHRCELVVLASHGGKGLRRPLPGSETPHALTHGNVPMPVLR